MGAPHFPGAVPAFSRDAAGLGAGQAGRDPSRAAAPVQGRWVRGDSRDTGWLTAGRAASCTKDGHPAADGLPRGTAPRFSLRHGDRRVGTPSPRGVATPGAAAAGGKAPGGCPAAGRRTRAHPSARGRHAGSGRWRRAAGGVLAKPPPRIQLRFTWPHTHSSLGRGCWRRHATSLAHRHTKLSRRPRQPSLLSTSLPSRAVTLAVPATTATPRATELPQPTSKLVGFK